VDLEADRGQDDAAAASWTRIKEILAGALELEAPARAGFLAAACGADAALRREVESLLAEEASLGDFLTEPIFSLHGEPEPVEDPNLGRVVGSYRLVRRLGHGGMGTVYLGERADGHFEQQVAVKLIKRGMDSDEILRRFRDERQILATLVDDHVARLYDGGTTEDGLPYFVMEYVEGEPIDRYCDRRGLSIGERLRLFHAVCDAVHVAHQNLVVHRDLKPGNVLVTADGVPKLLDFGIAKLLTADGGAADAPTVLGAALPFTPGYASPEQMRGEPVTTASDVYSLGVLLYVLLTGRRPYDADTLRPDVWAQLICEQEPPKPSTAVRRPLERPTAAGEPGAAVAEAPPAEASPAAAMRDGDRRRLRRRLTGDLDTIVMTAIAKDRRHRYGSAEQLAEDVRRHLEGLPVRARPLTLRYRAGKFVRRHGWGVGVAAAAVALLVGFAVTMTVQRNRTAVERDRAQRVTEFLVDSFEVSNPGHAKGEEITARAVLDQGAARIGAELAGQPLTEATLDDAMGRVYRNLGLFDQAKPLLEAALRLREAALGPDHPDTTTSRVHLSLVLRDLGDAAGAERLLREAIPALERHRSEPGGELALSQGLHNLASLLADRGQYDEAEADFRRALAIKRRLLEGRSDADLATTLNSLGKLMNDRGRLDQAEPLFREALAVRRAVHGPIHPEVSTALNNLATLLAEKKDYREAGALYEEDLALRRKLYGDDDSHVAVALNNLALLRQDEGDLAAAEPLFRQALAILEKTFGDAHPNVAVARRNLAALLAARGQPAACEEQARPALASLQAKFKPDHWRVADAESVLGGCLVGLGRLAEAEPLLVKGYEGVVKVQGDATSYARDARARLVALYEAWGRPDQAERYRGEPAPAAAEAAPGAAPAAPPHS
jgi:eukaryotic-like serine/threonine-protein kinase